MDVPTRRQMALVWIMWGTTIALTAVAVHMPRLTGVRGSGRWPVYAGVGLVFLTWLAIRKAWQAFNLALYGSASAVGIGAALGFLSSAVITGKPISYLLSLQWALGGAFLTWLFRRVIRRSEEAPLEAMELYHTLEAKSPEQVEEFMKELEAKLLQSRQELRRQIRIAMVVGAIAFVLLAWLGYIVLKK